MGLILVFLLVLSIAAMIYYYNQCKSGNLKVEVGKAWKIILIALVYLAIAFVLTKIGIPRYTFPAFLVVLPFLILYKGPKQGFTQQDCIKIRDYQIVLVLVLVAERIVNWVLPGFMSFIAGVAGLFFLLYVWTS